jgi:hypothetical protein
MLFFSRIFPHLDFGLGLRILILSLVNGRRDLLLLGLGGLALAHHDEHLVLEAVEAVMVRLVVLALSRGQLLVF